MSVPPQPSLMGRAVQVTQSLVLVLDATRRLTEVVQDIAGEVDALEEVVGQERSAPDENLLEGNPSESSSSEEGEESPEVFHDPRDDFFA